MITERFQIPLILAIAALSLPGIAMAQDAGTPDPEVIKDLYPGKTYSPYAQGE